MNSLYINLLQISLLVIIWMYAIETEHGKFIFVPNEVEILFSRFIASMMMHLMVEKDTRNGLNMMKYAVNHHERFTNPEVAFLMAALHCFVSFLIEFSVILVLLSLTNVLEVIMKYVALSATCNIPRFYYNSLYDNKLISICGSHKLKVENFRKDNLVANAPFPIKIMRVI